MKHRIFTDNHSPGCRICQDGKWLCVFLTYVCNGKCPFCPAPFRGQDKVVSALGDDPESIHRRLKKGVFRGISFSGGDCLMVFDRLMDWLAFFKKRHPRIYYWAYTNALGADVAQLRKLARAGLDEIRFNIAASGYGSAPILDLIAAAARLFPWTTVEIPAIPDDLEKLTAVLPVLDRMQVKVLNLHEYILVPGDPAGRTAEAATFLLNYEMTIRTHCRSRETMKKIAAFCRGRSLSLRVNQCSLEKKENQMFKRRLTMGKLLKKDYESLSAQGFLETYLDYPGSIDVETLRRMVENGDSFNRLEARLMSSRPLKRALDGGPQTRCKLIFLPALDVGERKKLFKIEKIE